MEEAALWYEHRQQFGAISAEKDDQRHWRKRKNTMATAHLDKYGGPAMLALAADPSARFQRTVSYDGRGESSQSLF